MTLLDFDDLSLLDEIENLSDNDAVAILSNLRGD